MSKRLEILKKSLEKKESKLNRKFDDHFDDVRRANGQPLNDKRCGMATFARWERQNDSIRNQIKEVEKTKDAIEREESKIDYTEYWYELMPDLIKELIDDGTLTQWRKHPRIMFVKSVEKARIYFHKDSGLISHKYLGEIPNKEQYAIFRDVFNKLNRNLGKKV